MWKNEFLTVGRGNEEEGKEEKNVEENEEGKEEENWIKEQGRQKKED